MTADNLREQARQARILDELAVMISPDHADALANLIDAASAVLENGEPPYSWPVYAAREMRDALAALIGGAR